MAVHRLLSPGSRTLSQDCGACLPDPRLPGAWHGMPGQRSAGSGWCGWCRVTRRLTGAWTLRRDPGPGTSQPQGVRTRRAASAETAVRAGMGGRGLSHPQEEPLTTTGAAEPRPRPGPAGSRGHERLIGWRCPRALPLGSVRALRGLDQHEQQLHIRRTEEAWTFTAGSTGPKTTTTSPWPSGRAAAGPPPDQRRRGRVRAAAGPARRARRHRR